MKLKIFKLPKCLLTVFIILTCFNLSAFAQTSTAATAPLSAKQQLLERFWNGYYATVMQQDPFRRSLLKHEANYPNDPNLKLLNDPRVIEKYKAEVKSDLLASVSKSLSETDIKYLTQLYESDLLKRFDSLERQTWNKTRDGDMLKRILVEVAAMPKPAPPPAPATAAPGPKAAAPKAPATPAPAKAPAVTAPKK